MPSFLHTTTHAQLFLPLRMEFAYRHSFFISSQTVIIPSTLTPQSHRYATTPVSSSPPPNLNGAPSTSRFLSCACIFFAFLLHVASGLGSMATIATSYDGSGGAVVCAIMQGSIQNIQCWNSKDISTSTPSSSSPVALSTPSNEALRSLPFMGISGGKGLSMCALRQDTGRPLCWDNSTAGQINPRRLADEAFMDIVVGSSQVCGLSRVGLVTCWREEMVERGTPSEERFSCLAAGGSFVCGLRAADGRAECWGNPIVVASFRIPNATFQSIQAGLSHACGITLTFNVQCWGDDSFNQLAAPPGKQFLSLALGDRHSCGIEAFLRNVVCWGDGIQTHGSFGNGAKRDAAFPSSTLAFSTIVAGDSFTCGVLLNNFSVACWGGRFAQSRNNSNRSRGGEDVVILPIDASLPGSCVTTPCANGSFKSSSSPRAFCSQAEHHVCTKCKIGCQGLYIQTSQCGDDCDVTCSPVMNTRTPLPLDPSLLPPSQSNGVHVMSTNANAGRPSKGYISLITFGASGLFSGVLVLAWCVWMRLQPISAFTRSKRRVQASVSTLAGPIRRRQQQEGRAQAFGITDLEEATNDFSEDKRIGAGSFGVVYRGVLADGRVVAIKRGEKESISNDKKLKEKESAFQSELEFLSRLHHKHLVSLVGYCDEEDERMLVYDYMPNGTLHDHLHGRGRGRGGGVLPWLMRIKVALEAAKGVEYLHSYVFPPIIHRDIKSSNILLDAQWNARVSDFGLSTHGPIESSHLSLMAAGTLGYMDPEYYRCQHLTIKSDVYSFGVVLLELLTGERAIHKQTHGPVNIVDFTLPTILDNEVATVLDPRPNPPTPHEFRALDMIAQLAAKCVRLEFKERPTMSEIVVVLEEAMGCAKMSSVGCPNATIPFEVLNSVVLSTDDGDHDVESMIDETSQAMSVSVSPAAPEMEV